MSGQVGILNSGARDAVRLRITPNRRQVDNRFPVLGFTIHTGGLSHFEVLLTTDRTLFDPVNAARRNANNFYASRQDSGLIKAIGSEAIYLTPPAVLRTFAGADPRPAAVYYTLIAYADAQGNNPSFAHDTQSLPNNAPAVSLSPDFRAQTLASVLGVATHKLRRTGGNGTNGRTAGVAALTSTNTGQISAADDAVEGEDGYATPPEGGVAVIQQSYAALDTDDQADTNNPQDGYEVNHSPDNAPRQASAATSGVYRDDLEYDDGFGDMSDTSPWESQSSRLENAASSLDPQGTNDEYQYDAATAPSWASAQESTFLEGAEEPVALEGTDYGVDEFGYDDGYGDGPGDDQFLSQQEYGQAYKDWDAVENDQVYGDEYGDDAHGFGYGDAYDDLALPYESLDAQPLGNDQQPRQLSIQDKVNIIERVGRFESGNERYAAINADGEFRGNFGHDHPAYDRYHIGLSYGIIQFTQDSGNLGQLLNMMRQRRDSEGNSQQPHFDRIFGPHADELIRVTTAPGPASKDSPGGRSARVQPVGGKDLWEEPWLGRFRQAAQHAPFQAAQNELAATLFIDPIVRFAGWLGLDTERALAMVVDRAVQMGVGGARRWIIRAVGPLQTPAQRQRALADLGYADLRSFQRATPGLDEDGAWGPQGHAALVAALRSMGAASPIQLPTREQMMDALVRRSASQRWGRRVSSLRQDTDLGDIAYQLLAPAEMPRPNGTSAITR